MACAVSKAFTTVAFAPKGKPTTVQILTKESAKACLANGIWQGLMQTE